MSLQVFASVTSASVLFPAPTLTCNGGEPPLFALRPVSEGQPTIRITSLVQEEDWWPDAVAASLRSSFAFLDDEPDLYGDGQ